ncbi:MAG: acyl-CoA--6-aminopenicillanic acid acyl-transferase [Ignavibacteria bacterium]|nr:acyl-CoA--6-aminopenicillanic acid acyl-transferase [Ignavibacteria bacterium]
MYHPRLKGAHYLMGQKMGNIFRRSNAEFPIRLDKFQREFGRESTKLLKEHFPEAAEEIRGVTDAAGYDNELFTSWMMCMGCCMYNMEESESVEVRGCTAFCFVQNGEIYYARNNDLPPFLKKVSKSEYYEPENKNRFILNTSSFINGEEGINEHGLVAAMTFVMPKIEEIMPGLNSVFLVRYILENCNTVAEGVNSLKNLPIASSCNMLLADRSGRMTVVECNPFEINIRNPGKNKAGNNFIITVNQFLSGQMRKYDAGNGNTYFSEERYLTAYNALKNGEYNDAIGHAKNILSGRFGFMCQYDKSLNFDTVWSSIFDIIHNRVYRAEGNPKSTRFKEDRRLM